MATQLQFGLTSVFSGARSTPEAMVQIAQAAENAGMDSIWAVAHPGYTIPA
ncbi:MAG TPA: hypothetical protein VFA41_18520 [Ktedonobacteraceae bacterium]|jgi:alkanesulfonate monooxygenase SsuD/methylene tetrahydromethanopterin reductase-like flavin-dependent oxidoreductase (luciferase family)|nr:hypothetical protein [Ktedonobacteraceae bacterium]